MWRPCLSLSVGRLPVTRLQRASSSSSSEVTLRQAIRTGTAGGEHTQEAHTVRERSYPDDRAINHASIR